MKISRTTKTIVFISAVLLIGATLSFAHGGWGQGDNGHMRGYGGQMMGPAYGGQMMDGPGYGQHMRGNGNRGNLSDEQLTQLEEARDKFRKETQELRGKIEEKSVVLRNEMIKDEPDTGKAMKLQKNISEMRADFDQKKLQHRLEVQKIAPDAFQSRGGGRGFRRNGGYCR